MHMETQMEEGWLNPSMWENRFEWPSPDTAGISRGKGPGVKWA